jgi:hypothetical protein
MLLGGEKVGPDAKQYSSISGFPAPFFNRSIYYSLSSENSLLFSGDSFRRVAIEIVGTNHERAARRIRDVLIRQRNQEAGKHTCTDPL